MKSLTKLALVLGLLVWSISGLGAQTPGPAGQKARAMVKDGIAFWQAQGKDKAIAAFNDVKGKFRDGEYYLFVFDYSAGDSAVCIARGDGNKSLLGKNMWAQKDPDNKLYIQEFVKVSQKPGTGWVDYKRTNPESKKIEAKSSYIERIPGTSIFIGCGFYKD